MASDARRKAVEALAFMDAALLSEMPPLPTQVKALADAVRDLLAEPQAPAPDGFDPTCPRCRRPLSDHHPDHNNDPVCADFPPAPAAPDELRKAAERHYSTLLSGLAYVVRGSWWPEHDELTNGVREHAAKMRDAADELRALAARGGK